MLSDFDKLVKDRDALQRWMKMGSTIARYDGANHVLRVDWQLPSMIAFCGQEYAGAKNYHDAPEFFAKVVKSELEKRTSEIVHAAYESAMAVINAGIEKHRELVLEQLGKA